MDIQGHTRTYITRTCFHDVLHALRVCLSVYCVSDFFLSVSVSLNLSSGKLPKEKKTQKKHEFCIMQYFLLISKYQLYHHDHDMIMNFV